MGGYSLWLVPKGEVLEKLQNVSDKLSQRYGGPKFVVHMTLIPDVVGTIEDVLEKTERIARHVKQFEISLEGMGYMFGSLYQCLYVKGVVSDKLVEAVRVARAEFDRSGDGRPYKPHISLVYKEDLGDVEKEKVISEVGESLNGLRFMVEDIQVFTSGLPIDGWRRVGKFKLS